MAVLSKAMELKEAFGRVFLRLRLRKGLSQEDFHDVATDRYIRNLEKGRASPTVEMLFALSDVLCVSPAMLMVLTNAEVDGASETKAFRALALELSAYLDKANDSSTTVNID